MSPRRALQAVDARAQTGEQSDRVAEQARTPYLTTDGLIGYLELGSESAVYRLIREHQMPFCRVGRLYRFDRREIDAWMRGHSSALALVRHGRESRRVGSVTPVHSMDRSAR